MALTDHDTIDGLDEFVGECHKLGVRPIKGVELSASAPITIHILGYRLSLDEPLREALSWVVERRNARNLEMCAKLRDLGIAVTQDDINGEAGGQVVARPHFASWLVKKGIVRDRSEAFEKYLARGALAYVPREAYSPGDCARIIIESGGLPVLAHPSLTGLDSNALGDLLEDLKAYGLWGLECVSSHCSAEETYGYLGIAERHSLFPTGGSDFHGNNRPGVTLGIQVSEDFLPWARLGVTI
jgi:predicted metal-dependent phosphoesterase TrpH